MCRLYRPKRNRPRLAKEVLCRVASNSMLVVLVVTSYMRIRRKNRRIQRKSTIALTKFLSTSSRVRTGLSGLPCSGSGRSEKRPFMIHDYRFLSGFAGFHRISPVENEFDRFWSILTEFCRLLSIFIDFYRVLSGFAEFHRWKRILPIFSDFYRVLSSFTDANQFYRFLSVVIKFYRVLPSFTDEN